MHLYLSLILFFYYHSFFRVILSVGELSLNLNELAPDLLELLFLGGKLGFGPVQFFLLELRHAPFLEELEVGVQSRRVALFSDFFPQRCQLMVGLDLGML